MCTRMEAPLAPTLSMREARDRLMRLPEQFAEEPESAAVAVTRRGKPVLAVMPWDLYEAIIETLEILGDEDQMAELRRGIRDVEAGRTVSLEALKADLGL